MPGFVVNNIGGNGKAVPATAEYYYTYTWQIFQLFNILPDETQVDMSPIIHAKDMSLPTFTVNKEMVPGASLQYKYAKDVTWDDIKISWYDTYGLLKIIRQWRRIVWTANQGLGPANTYKRTSRIINYLPHANLSVGDPGEVEYILKGSWPSIIRYGDLTYVNSEIKLVEVTLTYDWAEESIDDDNSQFTQSSRFPGGSGNPGDNGGQGNPG